MCILVVEDDVLIRMILVEELRDAGYEVQEAHNGDEAVYLIDHAELSLVAMITDIHMPGAHSGLEVAVHLRDRMPLIPIIFTTGRPDALAHLNRLGNNQYLVRKPYVPSDVIDRVRIALAA